MKKSLVIVLVLCLLVSLTFVSANWFGGLFGKITGEVVLSGNEKNELAYEEKEVFLVSDMDWKDVLELVPITTWTGDEDWCQEGYGTAENVCVYPTLIYHEEKGSFMIDNEGNVNEESKPTEEAITPGEGEGIKPYINRKISEGYSKPQLTYSPVETFDGKSLIRLFLEEDEFQNIHLKYDVASVGENYLDIVVDENEIDKLSEKGYEFDRLNINSFDLFDSNSYLETYDGEMYHSYVQMKSDLQEFEAMYPEIAEVHTIGKSVLGLDIQAIKISDNVDSDEDEKKVLIVGNHHAREIMTMEVPLYEAKYILEQYGEQDEITELVDNWELWFVPTANPDGHVRVEMGDVWWRKNLRDNNNDGVLNDIDGVDLNRNYGHGWGPDYGGSSSDFQSDVYRGTEAFSEPETRAIRDLVLAHEFNYVLDYHGYGGYILYPWGHVFEPTEDKELFEKLTSDMSLHLPNYYTYGQISDVMYFAGGNSIDWHYGEQKEKNKVISFGFELNQEGFRPPAELIEPTSLEQLMVLLELTDIDLEMEESISFDADSIIYFMQQYNVEKATIIGDTPTRLDYLVASYPNNEIGTGLHPMQTQRIIRDVEDFHPGYQTDFVFYEDILNHYWKEYKDVIYVEDNYELALLASTYASLKNVPLIIKESDLDKDKNFENKNVICVGNVDKNCEENYNLEELRQKYFEETNTDKIIVVNPDDLNINFKEEFAPEKSADSIYELYGKTSLVSPILASAKHELILSTNSIDYDNKYRDILIDYEGVDYFIEDKISWLGMSPEYLTIFSSPDAISIYGEGLIETDFKFYADIDSTIDDNSELAVGRIMGISNSDVSSLVARGLFYDELEVNKEGVMIMRGDPPDQGIPMNTKGTGFCKAYFDEECQDIFDWAYNKLDNLEDCDETLYLEYNSLDSYKINEDVLEPVNFEKSTKENILVDGNYITWKNNQKIFLHDFLEETTKEIIQNIPHYYGYSLDGENRKIAFANSDSEIYLYDVLSNNLKQITNDSRYKGDIFINNNQVIWTRGGSNIYLYNLLTDSTTKIERENNPWINDFLIGENYVVWIENFYDEEEEEYKIYSYNLDNEEINFVFESNNWIDNFFIENNNLIWESDDGNIYLYNLLSNDLKQITDDSNHHKRDISIDNGNIVWLSQNKIYIYDISTEFMEEIIDITNGSHSKNVILNDNYLIWMENFIDLPSHENDEYEFIKAEIYLYDINSKELNMVVDSDEPIEYLFLGNNRIIWETWEMELLIGREGYDVENVECDVRSEELVDAMYDSGIVVYADHGTPDGWHGISSETLDWLPPLFGYSFACSTCDYSDSKTDLFCTNMIRKGAIGYIGAVRIMYGHHFMDEFLDETLFNQNSIGKAFQIGKNKELKKDWEVPVFESEIYLNEMYGVHDVLIGDPTLKLFGGNK